MTADSRADSRADCWVGHLVAQKAVNLAVVMVAWSADQMDAKRADMTVVCWASQKVGSWVCSTVA